jgi:hypothetical protein
LPGTQLDHTSHWLALALLLKLPLAQPAQLRSTVGLPALVAYWPGTQPVCGVHVEALIAAVYVPVGQLVQTRSAVEPPAWLT